MLFVMAIAIHNLPDALLPALVHLPDAYSRQLKDARGHNAYGDGIQHAERHNAGRLDILLRPRNGILRRLDVEAVHLHRRCGIPLRLHHKPTLRLHHTQPA